MMDVINIDISPTSGDILSSLCGRIAIITDSLE
jgi:hypothetical protein